MTEGETSFVAILAGCLVATLALWLCWKLVRVVWDGAVLIFLFAGAQGFVGVAAYVACWIFMFPVMLVASLIVGLWVVLLARSIEKEERSGPN